MTKLILKNVRIGGNSIFEAKAYQEGQTPNYSAIFLLKPKDPQIEEIKEAIIELARERFKRPPKNLKTCLVPGDEKDNENYHGYITISASEKQRPITWDRLKNDVTAEDNVIYPGCYVNCIITLWAQDNKYGKRINANLRAVQYVRDGEPIGREPINADEDLPDLADDDKVPFNMDTEEAPLY